MGFKTDLPLRGAVTKGNFLIDNDRKLFLSKEFAELVHYEEKQEWSGCCILCQAEDIVIDSVYGQVDKSMIQKEQLANNMIHCYPVPFKGNTIENLFVINYMIFINKKDRQKHIDHMIDMKKINTATYANFITTSPCQVQALSPEFLPAVTMTFIKSRSGLRAIFYDKENNQCKPGIDKFTWVAIGR